MTLPFPKKILITTDAVGGVWAFAAALANVFAKRGAEILVASIGPAPSEAQRKQLAHPNIQLVINERKLEWMEQPWDDALWIEDWLMKLAAAFRPDVAHLNQYSPAAADWECPVLLTGHSCVLSWWRAVKGTAAPRQYDRYRDAVAAGIQRADRITAPTYGYLTELEELYGPLPPASVIYNGLPLHLYRPEAKEPRILTAGRLWDEAKNVRVLNEAADGISWPVYAAGSVATAGNRTEDLDRMVTLGLLGPAELRAQYATAAIYAAPAKYEPFGLSILEAAASGCSLVLADIPSLRELWGGAALFVHPDDIDGWRTTLQRLIHIAPLRDSLAEQAKERAQSYGIEPMFTRYAALYGGLLRQAEVFLA